MLSRRRFLKTSSLISLAPLVPSMIANMAQAASATSDSRVLVVIQMDGGNDGLNTVVPYADDGYGRNRTTLRLDTSRLHRLNDHVGLNPSMGGAKELFDDGQLTIVQGVGYPNPDRSHFRSMKIWQTARFEDDQHDSYGWLGRALDQREQLIEGPADSGSIFVGEQATPVALWSRRATMTALCRAQDLELQLVGAAASLSRTSDRLLDQFVSRQVHSAYSAAGEFTRHQAEKTTEPGRSYPDTELASRLRLISQLIHRGSPARVFYTVQTGYDTHSNQFTTHDRLLRQLSESLHAFLRDLSDSQLDDRVVVLAFSEFGRRVQENDSQGTDHGTSGPVFLAGRSTGGGLIGETSSLSELEDGDLKVQIDFRQVYATVLEKWLEIPSSDILGTQFALLPIFKA